MPSKACYVPQSRTRVDSSSAALLFLFLSASVPLSAAIPTYFLDSSRGLFPSDQKCVAHPAFTSKKHGSPSVDSGITFEISNSVNNAPTDVLCPGSEHSFKVSFGIVPRAALLNSNPPLVNFTSPSPTAGCPNQVVLGLPTQGTSFTTTFTVPCSAAGSDILFKVTSVGRDDFRWKYNTRSMKVADAASNAVAPGGVCAAAAAACGALPISVSAGNGQNTSAVNDQNTSGGNDQSGSVSPSPSTGGGGTQEIAVKISAPSDAPQRCNSSTLGYDCMAEGGKVTVHWSINTAAAPANPCTPTGKTTLKAEEIAQYGTIHMAVQSSTRGYVGMGFANNPGDMYPSDIIVGWVEGSGAGWVNTFFATANGIDMGDVVSPSWAYDTGVVRNSTSGLTTICFSRRLLDNRAKAQPDIREAVGATNGSSNSAASGRRRLLQAAEEQPLLGPALGLIWAVSPVAALVQHGDPDAGGFYLNVSSGSLLESKDGVNMRYWINVHGALMAVAWGLLLPLGTLFPAHRWLLGDAKVAGKHLWFWMHLACQWTGMALFIAGFVVAFTKMGGSTAEIVESHENIGIAIMAAAAAQVVLAYARPAPDHPRRGLWNAVHHNLGRVTVALAWANVYIGIYAYHCSWGASYAAWITPIAISMGLLVIADISLRFVGAGRSKDLTAVPAVPQGVDVYLADKNGGGGDSPAGGKSASP